MTIEYYTTGDGEELCVNCAHDRYPADARSDDADEHRVSIAAFDGWGGPVFVWDEGSTDRSTVCDDCGAIIRELVTEDDLDG